VEREVLAQATSLRGNQADQVCGRTVAGLLRFLVRLTGAQRVLEVGSMIGYSACAMLTAMPPSGELVTLEQNAQYAALAEANLQLARECSGGGRPRVLVGEAKETLARMQEEDAAPFQLAFLDADKRQYGRYYELLVGGGLLAPGGVLVCDNVLWKGLVAKSAVEPLPEQLQRFHRQTEALRAFNEMVASDPRVEPLMLPLADGVLVVRRR